MGSPGRRSWSRWRLTALTAGILAVAVVTALLVYQSSGNGNAEERLRTAPALQSFPTLEPGAELPSGAECAGLVRDGFEPVPENETANRSTPPLGYRVPSWAVGGYAPELNSVVVPRIDGQFTGTTSEIISWTACKWGFDADLLRAMAMAESTWQQDTIDDYSDNPADCVGGATVPCPTSFGLMQVKHLFRPGSYPYSELHTAFNADYAIGVVRACYEGWVTYLDNGYAAGDLWGCVGWHFSGEYRDPGALEYIDRVQAQLDRKLWLEW